MLWDLCKIKIKGYSIKYSKTIQKNKNKLYYELRSKLEDLFLTNDIQPNERNIKEIDNVTKQIDKIIEDKRCFRKIPRKVDGGG